MSRVPSPREAMPVPASAAASPKKPRYIELADQLRADILQGKFAQPEIFPTESELCESMGSAVSPCARRFAVSRPKG